MYIEEKNSESFFMSCYLNVHTNLNVHPSKFVTLEIYTLYQSIYQHQFPDIKIARTATNQLSTPAV